MSILRYIPTSSSTLYISPYEIKRLTLDDQILFDMLIKKCNEKENVNITIYDAYLYGIILDDILVGACSLIRKNDVFEIAILVHPEYRNKQIGKSLVSYVYNKLNKKNIIYEVDEKNIYSIQLIESLNWKRG